MNKQGVGLGLVISKKIVNQFNGEIRFDSEINVGSNFTYTFMLSPEDNVESSLEEQEVIELRDNRPIMNSETLKFSWVGYEQPTKKKTINIMLDTGLMTAYQ